MRRLASLIAALLVFAAPAAASASAISVGMYFPFGGDGGWGGSIGYGFGVSSRITLEARLGYYELGLDSDLPGQDQVWLDASLIRGEFLLRYKLVEHDVFEPYAIAGPVFFIPVGSSLRPVAGTETARSMIAIGQVAAGDYDLTGHTLGPGFGGSLGAGSYVYIGDDGFGLLVEGRVSIARASHSVDAEAPDGSTPDYHGEGSARLDGVEIRFGVLF